MVFDNDNIKQSSIPEVINVSQTSRESMQEVHLVNGRNVFNGSFYGNLYPDNLMFDYLSVGNVSANNFYGHFHSDDLDNIKNCIYEYIYDFGPISSITREYSGSLLSNEFDVFMPDISVINKNLTLITGQAYGSNYNTISILVSGDIDNINNYNSFQAKYITRELVGIKCPKCSCCTNCSAYEIKETYISSVSVEPCMDGYHVDLHYPENQWISLNYAKIQNTYSRISVEAEIENNDVIHIIQGRRDVLSANVSDFVFNHINIVDKYTGQVSSLILYDGILSVV